MTHPIDRLAVIRQTMEWLTKEAKNIRQQIESGEVGTVGDCYCVKWRRQLLLKPLKESPDGQ